MRLTKYWYCNLFDWNIITSKDKTSMMTRGNKRERHQAAQSRPKVHLQKNMMGRNCQKNGEKIVSSFFIEKSHLWQKRQQVSQSHEFPVVSDEQNRNYICSVCWNVSKTALIVIMIIVMLHLHHCQTAVYINFANDNLTQFLNHQFITKMESTLRSLTAKRSDPQPGDSKRQQESGTEFL